MSIFNNATMLLAAEILLIIIGSMLLGILLTRLFSARYKQRARELSAALEAEENQASDLKLQIQQLADTRAQLQATIIDLRGKLETQAKTLYDQTQYILSIEADHARQKTTTQDLQQSIDAYQQRLAIIEEELLQVKSSSAKPAKKAAVPAMRANYEYVSQLLGKQVTENDLTLITGIGPKTASLLQDNGITTWEDLAAASKDHLRKLLDEAGGIYKSQDASQWGKQAKMAARGEWRKLRVFQETLRKSE